ncbi:MAG: hypothetical protein ACT4P3_21700 [Betaproteobacteria bacterium]
MLAAIIVALHAAAAVCVFLAAPGLGGAALAALFLLLGLAAAWSRALLGSPRSVRALEIGGDGALLELGNGARLAAAHPGRCYVSRLVVILPLSRSILVSADMLRPGEFRRLRLWALWKKLPAVAGKQLPA